MLTREKLAEAPDIIDAVLAASRTLRKDVDDPNIPERVRQFAAFWLEIGGAYHLGTDAASNACTPAGKEGMS